MATIHSLVCFGGRLGKAGDLALPGRWKLQAYIEMPGWKGKGEWAELEVAD